MKNILADFFADASNICGHEKTFHANLCHHLLCSGLDPRSMAREYRIDGTPIDVVLFAEKTTKGWSAFDRPRIAIEFKGGAYGSRNALRDTIDINGYCKDLDKLASYNRQGIECWFVCVDIAELGISLSRQKRQLLAKRCESLGINFAYCAQNQAEFIFCKDGKMELCEIEKNLVRKASHDLSWQTALSRLKTLMQGHASSEDTYTSLLYHALRKEGFNATELSLETYFSCGKAGSRMHNRPDLCVFAPQVEGHFNLYRNGNAKFSNDGRKIGNLRAIIEIKESYATTKYTDKKFHKEIASDIEKLCDWRARFHKSGHLSLASPRKWPDFMMVVLDKRAKMMGDATLDSLQKLTSINNISFNYIYGGL